ncbi:hypothetical protein ACMFMG_003506 [Clarireedia jacksonii]
MIPFPTTTATIQPGLLSFHLQNRKTAEKKQALANSYNHHPVAIIHHHHPFPFLPYSAEQKSTTKNTQKIKTSKIGGAGNRTQIEAESKHESPDMRKNHNTTCYHYTTPPMNDSFQLYTL